MVVLRKACGVPMSGQRNGIGALGRSALVAAALAAMGVIAMPERATAQYAAGNATSAGGGGSVGVSGDRKSVV